MKIAPVAAVKSTKFAAVQRQYYIEHQHGINQQAFSD
jgi:hypothetical protein